MIKSTYLQHDEAVDYLCKRLRQLQDGIDSVPRIVLLRGASGVGKTWIARQVFDRLRIESERKSHSDAEPQYWPDLAKEKRTQSARVDPLAARKEITPDPSTITWLGKALPTFGWWGFNCERLAGGGFQKVRSDASSQLSVHSVPLALSWKQDATAAKKFQDWLKKSAAEVRTTVIDEGPGEILGLIGLEVPFQSALLKWAWNGAKSVKAGYATRERLANDIQTGAELLEADRVRGAKLAQTFLSLTHKKLPGVIVVEDMHLMGPDVVTMINEVGKPNSKQPLLTIGTVWPEGSSNKQYEEWLEHARSVGAGVEFIDVSNLSQESLVKIVKDSKTAKHTDDLVAERIVQPPLNNPFHLKLWLSWRRIRRHARRHGDALTSDAEALRLNITQVFDERWLELPETVRDVLLCAAVANPLQANDEPLMRFVPEVITDLFMRMGAAKNLYWDSAAQLTRPEVESYLRAASDSAAWSSYDATANLQRFSEIELANTVRRQVSLEYGQEDQAEIAQFTLECVSKWLQREQNKSNIVDGTPDARLLVRWYLQLAQGLGAFNTLGNELPAYARWQIAKAAHADNPARAIEIGESTVEALEQELGAGSQAHLEIRFDLAIWVGDAGRFSEGRERLSAVWDDAIRLHSQHVADVSAAERESFGTGGSDTIHTAFSQSAHLLADERWTLAEDTSEELTNLEHVLMANKPNDPQGWRRIIAAFDRASNEPSVIMDVDFIVKQVPTLERLCDQQKLLAIPSHDPALYRAHELLAEMYTVVLSHLDHHCDFLEFDGKGQPIAPELDPDPNKATYFDEMDEASLMQSWMEQNAHEAQRESYEFVQQFNSCRDEWIARSQAHYEFLLEVAVNTNDRPRIAGIKKELDQIAVWRTDSR